MRVGVGKDVAFETVIVAGGLRLRGSDTCGSRIDGGEDNALAKMCKFGAE